MKKLLLAFGLACICAPSIHAQAKQFTLRTQASTSHYVQWTWSAPTSGTPAQAYNFYQAPGTCGSVQTFVQLVTGTTLTNWQQTTLPTTVTCSYVTAVSAVGVEGPPSASFQLDLSAPGAPGPPNPSYH